MDIASGYCPGKYFVVGTLSINICLPGRDVVNDSVDMEESIQWMAVERLQEYRTALITTAVTSKVDVRSKIGKLTP